MVDMSQADLPTAGAMREGQPIVARRPPKYQHVVTIGRDEEDSVNSSYMATVSMERNGKTISVAEAHRTVLFPTLESAVVAGRVWCSVLFEECGVQDTIVVPGMLTDAEAEQIRKFDERLTTESVEAIHDAIFATRSEGAFVVVHSLSDLE
jgi:hypothetical protein